MQVHANAKLGPSGRREVVRLVEALLVALAIQVPLLLYVWADLGPLTLIAAAAIQAPFALVATLIARRRGVSAAG